MRIKFKNSLHIHLKIPKILSNFSVFLSIHLGYIDIGNMCGGIIHGRTYERTKYTQLQSFINYIWRDPTKEYQKN